MRLRTRPIRRLRERCAAPLLGGHRIARTRAPAQLALIALVAALMTSAPQARAATPASYGSVVAQIQHGPVIRAVINAPLRHVEIKFRDLSEWEAVYPPGAQSQLQRLLHRRRIHVIFASHHRSRPKAAVHHHLRYIAAGLLIAALVLVGLALALRGRSRRGSRPNAQTPLG
jgi:hypothetical protein